MLGLTGQGRIDNKRHPNLTMNMFKAFETRTPPQRQPVRGMPFPIAKKADIGCAGQVGKHDTQQQVAIPYVDPTSLKHYFCYCEEPGGGSMFPERSPKDS